MRVDRLEKHVLARSPARTELSSIKAQLATAAPDTIRGLSVKRGVMRTRYFGQSSTRAMINLVSSCYSRLNYSSSFLFPTT